MNLEKYAASGNEFLREVAEELRIPGDIEMAGRIVRSVLHALRARLTLEEAFDLMAQLPLALRGVFGDGWRPTKGPDKSLRTAEDFLNAVTAQDPRTSLRDFPNPMRTQHAVQAVFRVLKRHVSRGESADVAGQLPRRLRPLWVDA
jgi:uncharacterized protein (DUF2267 family)